GPWFIPPENNSFFRPPPGADSGRFFGAIGTPIAIFSPGEARAELDGSALACLRKRPLVSKHPPGGVILRRSCCSSVQMVPQPWRRSLPGEHSGSRKPRGLHPAFSCPRTASGLSFP